MVGSVEERFWDHQSLGFILWGPVGSKRRRGILLEKIKKKFWPAGYIKSQVIVKVDEIHPLGTFNIYTTFCDNPLNSFWDFSLKTKTFNPMAAPKDHQSQQASSSGDPECLYLFNTHTDVCFFIYGVYKTSFFSRSYVITFWQNCILFFLHIVLCLFLKSYLLTLCLLA